MKPNLFKVDVSSGRMRIPGCHIPSDDFVDNLAKQRVPGILIALHKTFTVNYYRIISWLFLQKTLPYSGFDLLLSFSSEQPILFVN